MTTPQQRSGSGEREIVYCHACRNEWYRDEHGIICPNCQSDFVEILENDNEDPRYDGSPQTGAGAPDFLQSILQTLGDIGTPHPGDYHHHEHDHDHDHDHSDSERSSPHPPMPGAFSARVVRPGATVVHLEGPGFSYHSTRTQTVPPGDEMVVDLFGTMFRNIIGDSFLPSRPPGQGGEGNDEENDNQGERQGSGTPPGPHRTERTPGPRVTPYATAFIPGRLSPRDASSPQVGPEAPEVVDIQTFLSSLFHPAPIGHTPQGPLPGFLAGLFPPGTHGDYVYSQADLDRVISQLMEQHQGNAPPPAPKEVIEALPRIKVTKEMVDDGTDCAVCKDDLTEDEEVCKLPCKHIYHFECVSKWLEAHDTCPICRHPVTPEDKQHEQREAQVQRQREQVASNPLTAWALGDRGSSPSNNASAQTTSSQAATDGSNNNQQSSSEQDQQQHQDSSSHRSPLSGFANLFRRHGSNN